MALSLKTRFNLNAAHLPGGLHYSWIIVGVLAMMQIVGQSISMAVGVMVAPLNDPNGSFGWNMGTIGVALALYYTVGALFAPVSGWLGDRFGPRLLMPVGGALYGASMILLGFVTELWQFFLVFSVMLALTQSITMVPLLASVSRWFKKRLGLGVGLLLASGGIGSAILAPLVGFLLDTVGWQTTFWSIGIVGGGLVLLLSPLMRNKPADLGLKPFGATGDEPPDVVRSRDVEKLRLKVFTSHMRRTKAFWNLPLIHGLGCAGHGIVLIYSIPLAVEQGLSLTAAGGILGFISLFSIGGRFITPILAERFGGKPVMTTALFIQGLTVLVLFWASDVWMFYLFGVLFGIGFGGEMSAYLVVNRQYFGSGPLSTYYGIEIMGAMLGHATATVLAGLAIFLMGSFAPALIMSMAFSFVGVVVIWTLESSEQVLIGDWEASLPEHARAVEPGLALLHAHE